MTLASCALLRESDRCSRPADGRTHRCEFGRTRGARYRIAAMLVGKRFQEWHAHIVLMADLGHGGDSRVTGVVGAA